MTKKTIEFDASDDGNAIAIPFDLGNAGRYEIEIFPEDADAGDGIVLAVDKTACASLAQVFGQLATGDYQDGYHVHLGWNEEDTQAPRGFRIVLTESGRIDREG